MQPGDLLIATPLLVDPHFARSVVYLFGFADGPAGVILNRPTDLTVAATLPGWESVACAPPVVHLGGPVAVDHAIALGTGVHDEMVTADIGVVDLDRDPPAGSSIRVFAGYAGWTAQQLEGEMSDGAWFVVPGSALDVLDPHPEDLWKRVLARQPGRLRQFATYPDDPRLN